MNDSHLIPHPSGPAAEVLQLRRELQIRNQLSEQLAGELFRLIQQHPELFTPVPPEAESVNSRDREPAQNLVLQELESLRYQFQEVEQQIRFYQEQIASRDAEIARLTEAKHDLSDRNLMLEQVIQELPEVYRQKFTERLAQVKAKMENLEQENRRLHTELQNISYRLAMQTRRVNQVELPNFSATTTNKPVRVMSHLRNG